MTGGLGLVVRFTLRDGAGAAFDRLVAETVEQMRAREPGTLIYVCHEVETRPDQRLFYELYRDREAFDAHEAQPHVRRFLAEREQYLVGTEVDFLAPVAASGMPAARRPRDV